MSGPLESTHQRFLDSWRDFIDSWATRTVQRGGGSPSDVDDVRQSAYLAAYEAYLRWEKLPPEQRTSKTAGGMVGAAARDAVIEHWAQTRDVPRNAHQRGGGARAEVLRAGLGQLARRDARLHARLEVISHALVGYHLLMEGLVHGSTGLVRADTVMLRNEVRDRVVFAVAGLHPPELQRLIKGFYFEGRSFKDIGEELGISSSSRLWRMHLAALEQLREPLIEFASALSATHTGGSLDERPSEDAST